MAAAAKKASTKTSGTKGNTGRKSSGSQQTARKSTRSSSGKRDAKKQYKSTAEEVNIYKDQMAFETGITILIMLTVAMFFYLSFFGVFGKVGIILSGLSFGFFGWLAWLLPLYIVLGYTFAIVNQGDKRVPRRLISAGLFGLSLASLLELLFPKEILTEYYTSNHVLHRNYFDCVYRSLRDVAKGGKGSGGMIGRAIGDAFSAIIGKAGAAALLFALALLCVYIFYGLEWMASLRKRNAYHQEMEEAYDQIRGEEDYQEPSYRVMAPRRAARRKEKAQKGFPSINLKEAGEKLDQMEAAEKNGRATGQVIGKPTKGLSFLFGENSRQNASDNNAVVGAGNPANASAGAGLAGNTGLEDASTAKGSKSGGRKKRTADKTGVPDGMQEIQSEGAVQDIEVVQDIGRVQNLAVSGMSAVGGSTESVDSRDAAGQVSSSLASVSQIPIYREEMNQKFGAGSKPMDSFAPKEEVTDVRPVSQIQKEAAENGNDRIPEEAAVNGNDRIPGEAADSGNDWISGEAADSGNDWIPGEAADGGNDWIPGEAAGNGNSWIPGEAADNGNGQSLDMSGDSMLTVEPFVQGADMDLSDDMTDGASTENVVGMSEGMSVSRPEEDLPTDSVGSVAAGAGSMPGNVSKKSSRKSASHGRIGGDDYVSASETFNALNDSKMDTEEIPYQFPPIDLLVLPEGTAAGVSDDKLRETAARLQATLGSFNVNVQMGAVTCGPTVTRYEVLPEQGVRVNKITNLADDLKLSLAAANIRIEAPIPGKSAVGIEVPNDEPSAVHFRELLEGSAFEKAKSPVTFAVGKDIAGKVIVTDIAKMPHLLIAGATGSGKSVCINTLIMSILYKSDPNDVKLIMIDPKVVELSVYNGIPHLFCPVVTDPKEAAASLNWAVREMMDRYNKFKELGVRNIQGYNDKIKTVDHAEEAGYAKMPLLVIIVDEFADLMMVASKEVEEAVCRLAQLARAAGIHLILATQRPSVNVITGVIKANIPSRIAFSVSSAIDSRTILDKGGAEKLLGKGDMLFFPSGYSEPVRLQGAFVSDKEVSDVVEFLRSNNETPVYNDKVTEIIEPEPEAAAAEAPKSDKDEYFEEAGRFVIESERAAAGQLQRKFSIGFNRAGRIIDQLHKAGVVGPAVGTKPRQVLMTMEQFDNYLGLGGQEGTPVPEDEFTAVTEEFGEDGM